MGDAVGRDERAQRRAVRPWASVAMTTRPPVISGSHSSRPEMSNDSDVTASQVAEGPLRVSSRMDSSRFVSAAWPTSTPLGFPVEPEV